MASSHETKRWAPLPPRTGSDLLAPAYFAAYLGWLFLHPESELLHWLTLVLLPILLVRWAHRSPGGRLGTALASLGLRRGAWARGLPVAVVLGALIGVYQALGSRSSDVALEAFRTGRVVWLLPLGFVLMLLLAGFTEELFFRGFLQTRLEALLRSRIAGLLAASLCFGVYHLPYAYFNPMWPSAGDWGAAWAAALGQGIPGGLLLGGLYLYSGRNLLAPVVLHSLIGAFPAMGVLRFGGG
ncbi:MAG: CPBP family intramembrane metalloprotease [Gemmatimonadota bacterium]|jgi:membrane protease YdiL (CAAX protease family)